MGIDKRRSEQMSELNKRISTLVKLLDEYTLRVDTNQASVVHGNFLEINERNLIERDPNAFFLGLISDQSVLTHVSWSLPYKLSLRLGHINVGTLASEFSSEMLEQVIRKSPALHRYPSTISRYIWSASKRISQYYDSDISNVWKYDTSAITVIQKMMEFNGIGAKKANLGCLMLINDYGIELVDRGAINMADDVHVRRVCNRVHIIDSNISKVVSEFGKLLCPEFPGKYSTVLWLIGRNYCRPTKPLCDKCPIRITCISADKI